MRWDGGRESDNVEDQRGGGGGGFGGGFGGGGFSIPGGVVGGGGIGVVVLAVVALLFGVDPGAILDGVTGGNQVQPRYEEPARNPSSRAQQSGAGEDEGKRFVRVVLGDTEDTWRDLFKQMGRTYEDPRLVLFTDRVRSACGMASEAMGPFYCPPDHKVYLDLAFFDDMKTRFRAPGDFARAYVIAHEVGHHVQTLLGITQRVTQARQQLGETEGNRLSVRVELQADCFAGVWAKNANQARGIIESGDIEAAMNAAAAVGDDRLQKQARGYVVPESFTHGSSAQRVRWFRRGFDAGDIKQCDTFGADRL